MNRVDVQVRPEVAADVPQIRDVNIQAFGASTEADLVDELRQQAQPLISLVADDGGALVGHIMFSPVTLLPHPDLPIMGLAPMAVVPARQRHGIGSALVREGLGRCRQLDAAAVIVLGHVEYYPRFGFAPASRFGLRSEYPVPDDVFMALELRRDSLKGKSGTIRYHPAFPIA